MRLFVAIQVPETVKTAIAAAQEDLRSRADARAFSWTKPEQFHLTLKFLGEVHESNLDPLITSLAAESGNFHELQTTALGTGCFPTSKRPRVIWIGLQDASGQLHNLHKAVQAAAGPYSAEKPEDRFHAHVTIARIRDPGGIPAGLGSWAERWRETNFGNWITGEIVLMQSKLSPKGATHTAVRVFSLASRHGA